MRTPKRQLEIDPSTGEELLKSKYPKPKTVPFDWRQLSRFYEGSSGRSFYHDYKFGHGRDVMKNYFKGKTLLVDGEEWNERVSLEG